MTTQTDTELSEHLEELANNCKVLTKLAIDATGELWNDALMDPLLTPAKRADLESDRDALAHGISQNLFRAFYPDRGEEFSVMFVIGPDSMLKVLKAKLAEMGANTTESNFEAALAAIEATEAV